MTSIIMIAVGSLFMVLAPFMTRMKGALGAGNARPVTFFDRLIFFLVGLLSLGSGLHRLIK